MTITKFDDLSEKDVEIEPEPEPKSSRCPDMVNTEK
jgi:hypothetical protein